MARVLLRGKGMSNRRTLWNIKARCISNFETPLKKEKARKKQDERKQEKKTRTNILTRLTERAIQS